MKILFITKLMATASAGPNWSVPARIKAQAKFDDVFWINCDKSIMNHWLETGLYHNVSDIGGKLNLKSIASCWDSPDIVVFEVPYFIQYLKFASELRNKGIPYIIVPRCSFTYQALNNHSKWKKKIAGWLMFNRFFKGASAVQYLTIQEKNDSTPFLCNNNFVIPNGIELPRIVNSKLSNSERVGIFIGRIDIYHKGLDLLLEAIMKCREVLRNNNVKIEIYGPKTPDYYLLEQKAIDGEVDDLFVLKGEISGIEKDKVLENSDFFIMTSRFEGQPMALLEALSYSLPCIVSDGTYMREKVEEFGAGIGCKCTVDDICRVLKVIAINPEILYRCREKARILASTYQWSDQAAKFHEILQNLI